MDGTDRARLFDDLHDAAAALRAELDGLDGSGPLDAQHTRDLERIAERYHRAHDAISREVEAVIKRTSRRART